MTEEKRDHFAEYLVREIDRLAPPKDSQQLSLFEEQGEPHRV